MLLGSNSGANFCTFLLGMYIYIYIYIYIIYMYIYVCICIYIFREEIAGAESMQMDFRTNHAN